jgi:hypothetical protein
MANMGYCRFQNTVRDMNDCMEHIDDDLSSEDEKDARREFVEMCVEIAENYGELVER